MDYITTNFHSHTWRCGHAWGTEREYVETAIAAGFKVWGFSDHTPIPGYSPERSAGMRMTMDELDGYAGTVRALGREYKDKLDIHTGLEAEYDSEWFGELAERAGKAGVEYLILGQHFITGGVYSGAATDDPAKLRDYCRRVMEGMETGLFSLVAHPDLFNFTGDPAVYEAESLKLCRRALELNVPLELNLLGLATGRHYPNPSFWRAAAQVGNQVVLSLDAHAIEHICNREAEKSAFELIHNLGLHVTDMIDMTRLR